MADRPANEHNSITARGYTVANLSLNYSIARFNFGVQVENILNTEWEETQFATLSRLKFEQEPVEEIHFTPGNPINLRINISYSF